MSKICTILLTTVLLAEPVQAAGLTQNAGDVQFGTFVGARVRMSLGGDTPSRPDAALTIAPTLSRRAFDGSTRMRIGEGVALSFKPESKPSLTLAGVPADAALGLQRRGKVDANQKLGLSTVGWVAIGVGVAVVAGALLFKDALDDASE